jgi:hypothetical protein
VDQDHQLRAGIERAGQVVVEIAHVLDDLGLSLGHGRAADALAHADERVLGLGVGAGEGSYDERLASEQVDAGPVPRRMGLVQEANDAGERLLVGRIRGYDRLDLGDEAGARDLALPSRCLPFAQRLPLLFGRFFRGAF